MRFIKTWQSAHYKEQKTDVYEIDNFIQLINNQQINLLITLFCQHFGDSKNPFRSVEKALNGTHKRGTVFQHPYLDLF